MIPQCSIVIAPLYMDSIAKGFCLRKSSGIALLISTLVLSCSLNEDLSVGREFIENQDVATKTAATAILSDGIIDSAFSQLARDTFSTGPVLFETNWNDVRSRIFLSFIIGEDQLQFKSAELVLHELTPIRRVGPTPALSVAVNAAPGIGLSDSVAIQENDSLGTWTFRVAIGSQINPSDAIPDTLRLRIDFADSTDFIRRFYSRTADVSLRPALLLKDEITTDTIFADSAGFVAERLSLTGPVASTLPFYRTGLSLNTESLSQVLDTSAIIARVKATFFIDTASVLAEDTVDTLTSIRLLAGIDSIGPSPFPAVATSGLRPGATPQIELDATRFFQEFQMERKRTGGTAKRVTLLLEAQTSNYRLAIIPFLDSLRLDFLFSTEED